MPTTLVFGASRGLGRAFTDQALRQGHRVLALVRQPEMAVELRTLGVEVIEGDALDPAAVQQAAVPGGLLVLPDPDGAPLRYDYVSHAEHASGDLTWVGRAEGAALGQEAVVTVPRALLAETIDLIAVLVRDGHGRRLAELARVEGIDAATGDYRITPAIPNSTGEPT